VEEQEDSISEMRKLFHITAIALILIYAGTLQSQDFWVQTNGPYGGAISEIVLQANGHFFIGTAMGGGVYKSTNNGSSWYKVFNPVPIYSISSLTKDKYNNLYAGSNTIYKSSDDGSTWIPYENYTYGTAQVIAVNSQGHIFSGNVSGIYRSTNNGADWTRISFMYGYQPGFIVIANNGDIYLGLAGGWIRKSTDN
jgi:photosystem II stability/assembly factor-like uncharacterized protein